MPAPSEADGGRHERPTKTMLVAWALGEVGGTTDFADKTDVAVFAFRAYPGYFGFQKYPEFPDVDAVRVQLDDLLKNKHSRAFGIDGDVPLAEKTRIGPVTHWRLTAHGAAWWRAHREGIRAWVERNANSNFGTTKAQGGQVKVEEDAKRALVERVKSTPGFAKWLRNRALSRREVGIQTFFTAFGIGPRSKLSEYRLQRDVIMGAAKEEPPVLEFLKVLDKAFGDDYRKILAGEVQL